jgi:hypothetical protein
MRDVHHVAAALMRAQDQHVVELVEDDELLHTTVELRHRTAVTDSSHLRAATSTSTLMLAVFSVLSTSSRTFRSQIPEICSSESLMEDADLAVLFHTRTEFRRAEVAQMLDDDPVGVSLGDHSLGADEADGLLVLRLFHSRRTDVGGEDEDALAEVDDLAIAQGVVAVAEDAQQNLVELAASLLPLVDQNNSHRSLGAEAAAGQVVLAELRVGVDLVGQRRDVVLLLTVGVADEVGAGAGELAEVVLLLVLAAVDLEHRLAIAVEVFTDAIRPSPTCRRWWGQGQR